MHGTVHVHTARTAGWPVTLLSAPGAALYAGAPWWAALLRDTAFTGPALLDCAAAPGRAVEALRLGLKGVVLAPCPAWDEVAALAAATGALLLPAAPPALDLALPGAARHLPAWLAGATIIPP